MNQPQPKARNARTNRSAASPRSSGRRDDGTAFLPDPSGGPTDTRDSFAADFAEQFLRSATSGEESTMEAHNKPVPEELGGPFVPSSSANEFGTARDSTNPPDAVPEALPSPMRGTP